MKQDTREVKDYTYEKKEEYRRRLESQMRELGAKTEELKGRPVDRSAGGERRRERHRERLHAAEH